MEDDDSVSEIVSETFKVVLAASPGEECFVGFTDNKKPEIQQSKQSTSLPATNVAQTVANEKAKVSL